MSLSFKINKDYLDNGAMYKKENIVFEPGLTVLVGCNGAGKTTFIRQVNEIMKKAKVPIMSYDNLIQGSHNALDEALFHGNMNFVLSMVTSSEGEGICGVFNQQMIKLINYIKCVKKEGKYDTIVYTIDALDSGLSINNAIDVKKMIHNIIEEAKASLNIDMYFIMSSNSYELAREENCFDVVEGDFIKFKDYEDYRSFILKSQHKKETRDRRWDKNAERKRRINEKHKEEENERIRKEDEEYIKKYGHPSYRKRFDYSQLN